MLNKKEKKQFQEYYYRKYGEAYDLDDPAFPFFFEIYEAGQNKGINIRTAEAAQALQAEKNRAKYILALATCAAVGLICLTFYFTRPHRVYSDFIENSEIRFSPDGKTQYLRLQKTDDGSVIGKTFIQSGNIILIPLTKEH